MVEHQKNLNRTTHTRVGGLTSGEAEQSRRTYGENRMTRCRQKSFVRQFVDNLGDPVIRILLGALAVKL